MPESPLFRRVVLAVVLVIGGSATMSVPAAADRSDAAAPLAGFAQISVGKSHTCAVLDTGDVTCWGDNNAAQLGTGDRDNRGDDGDDELTTVDLGGLKATAVATGGYNTCVIVTDGRVLCWGLTVNGGNGLGLGDGLDTSDPDYWIGDDPSDMGSNLRAVDLGTDRTAVAITAGEYNVCVILDNAKVKCWGENGYGQSGQPRTIDEYIVGDEPGEMGDDLPELPLDDGATAISAGYLRTCALLTTGGVQCWGYNSSGQLGYGYTNGVGENPGELEALGTVELPGPASAIAAGGSHTCAIVESTVRCWGANDEGQLGDGDTTERRAAAVEDLPEVSLSYDALAVSVGDLHTCALLSNASVKCWGYGDDGQLGSESTLSVGRQPGEMGDALLSVDLGTSRLAFAISAGERNTCAVLDNATVKCWGFNEDGNLGIGDTDYRGNSTNTMGDELPVVPIPGTIQAVGLHVTLAPKKATVNQGDVAKFTATITNTGARVASSVFLTVPGTDCSRWVNSPTNATPTVVTCSTKAKTPGKLTRTATATSADFVGSTRVTAQSAAATVTVKLVPSYRPDGLVRVGSKAFLGNGVYNTKGTKQTVKAAPKVGRTATFTIRLQNDGNVADTLRVAGNNGNTKFEVTYLVGKKDVTSDVIGGTFRRQSMAPGAKVDITVKVTPKKLAKKGEIIRLATFVNSMTDSTKRDTVAIVVTRA